MSTIFIKSREMAENIQNYTQSDLKFSSSKLYFQHQNQILQKLWFISPMTIDIYFKYTFQEVNQDYFIEWWEFEWLTVDHDVHEQGIIYKVWFLRPKFKNVGNLSLDLSKKSNKSIWPLIFSFVWWCCVFGLLFVLSSKFKLWKILFWLNIIWASVLFLYYLWWILDFFYRRTIHMDKGKVWNYDVKLMSQSDLSLITPEVLQILDKLKKEYWIIDFGYTWNCIYMLQDVHDHEWNKLVSSAKMYSEQEKASLQQKTMDFIRQPEFLSHFMEQ